MSMSMDDSGEVRSVGYEKKKAWDADIKWHPIESDGKLYRFRNVARPFYFVQHWVTFTSKAGKVVSIPFNCLNWNHVEQKFVENDCPHCLAQCRRNRKTCDLLFFYHGRIDLYHHNNYDMKLLKMQRIFLFVLFLRMLS